MEDLQLRFSQFLRKKFVETNDLYSFRFVLAISGGIDSMVMLDLFRKEFDLKNIVVAHLDHMIREDSSKDLGIIKDYCLENGLEFVAEAIDVTKFPGNLEANARQVRYNFLEKVRRDYSGDWIVTAHHIDDQAETIFMSQMKGAFVSGMSGIDFKDDDRRLLRPLLFADKSDLIKYSKERNIKFVFDETNKDNKYDRNFLRNDIFPKLGNRFEGFSSRMADLAEFYRDLDIYLFTRVEKWIEAHFELKDYGWVCDIDVFLKLPGFMRFMTLQKITQQRYDLKMSRSNFADIDDMLERGNSGKMKKVGDYYVYIFKGKILISRQELSELEDWYWKECLKEFEDELFKYKGKIQSFNDGMKVLVKYGKSDSSKEVPLKDFLKQQNVPWFFRKGVPVLLEDNGLVDKCWVL